MSSISRHDNDRNAGDVVPGPQTTDPTLTNVDMADPTVQTTALNNKNSSITKQFRLRWMSTAPVARTLGNGVTTVVYPVFVSRDNWMDIMLVCQLISCRPFDANRGMSLMAWETCAEFLSKARDPQDNLVYRVGIKGKQLKTRFLELMALIKKVERQVPFKSGCDDEIEESELQLALEDLSVMYAASLNATASLTTSVAAARAKDKEDAETARRGAMGKLTKEEMQKLKAGKRGRGRTDDATPNKRALSTTAKLVSPAGAIGGADAFASQMANRIALQEKKLALKEKKMTMELQQQKENRDREFKMQEQMMNFMTAVMNRFPDGGSVTRVAPSITAFAPHDHSAAGEGGGRPDYDSDKEN